MCVCSHYYGLTNFTQFFFYMWGKNGDVSTLIKFNTNHDVIVVYVSIHKKLSCYNVNEREVTVILTFVPPTFVHQAKWSFVHRYHVDMNKRP